MIIVSGMSGAGKTVALHALEDLGYYCIDNLPINLLSNLYEEEKQIQTTIAVGIDIRNRSADIKDIPHLIREFKQKDQQTKVLFINANTDILVKRFSESKRRHPLSQSEHGPLIDSIEKERYILSPLLLTADCNVDSSHLNIYQLKDRIYSWLNILDKKVPVITLSSFGFKNGVPIDADIMFDVRFLPNPYWEKDIRHLNGCDEPIANYLLSYKETHLFIDETFDYLCKRLPSYLTSHRSYLTIAIGCTGGHHRSVFVAEMLYRKLAKKYQNLHIRHRDLDLDSA